jgi:hypothetical protein
MRNKAVTFLYILLGCCLFFGAASRVEQISNQRTEHDLDLNDPFTRDELKEVNKLRLPLEAMSIFRSLLINYLWIRADQLKNDGQYFDANYMASLICKLQPNLDTVWDFHGWNLAYNISVQVKTPPERWQWVQRGIELYRDEGIPANPRSSELHYKLAWTLFHKCGGITDDYHRYYKMYLAADFEPIIIGRGSNEEIQALADAPLRWEEVVKDQKVFQVVQQLKQAGNLEEDQEILDLLWQLLSDSAALPEIYQQTLLEPENHQAVQSILVFLRARQLREKWKMDPKRMLDINQMYGPMDIESEEENKRFSLDWRHPSTMALYWTLRAVELTPEDESFKKLQAQRLVYYALQNLFLYGRIQIFYGIKPPLETEREEGRELLEKPEKIPMDIFLNHDIRMFPHAYQATMDLIAEQERKDKSAVESVINGSINLCRNGILRLYLAGFKTWAEKYYRDLQKRYPERELFQYASFEAYIQREFKDKVADISTRDARGFIDAMLRKSLKEYALGDNHNAKSNETLARQLHEMIEAEDYDQGRLNLPPFLEMVKQAALTFFNDQFVQTQIKNRLYGRLKVDKPDVARWLENEWQKAKASRPQGQTNGP